MDSPAAISALSALAHPQRLATFRMLVQAGPEGLAAGEIARRLEAPANTLSQNLAILTGAALVQSRREGRSIIYGVNFGGMNDLMAFLAEDCCGGRPELCGPLGRVECA